MRNIGTQAKGIRLPIISKGDALPQIVADRVIKTAEAEGFSLAPDDIIAVKEAVVAKSQGNYASLDHFAQDIRQKYPGGKVGVVFPIMSRNRFLNHLKGIVKGADEVFVLLSYPADEFGNPVMDIELLDEVNDKLKSYGGPVPAAEFIKTAGRFPHPFTHEDYISLYESAGAKVYLSQDPRDILKLTPHVIAADVHTRFRTQSRLKKAGAETVYTLSDILSKPVNGSGFNPDYGVLGANIASDDVLKLFPKDCGVFVEDVRNEIKSRTGVSPHVMVYGDGAFKDPVHGIWELADPVVSPGYTEGLEGQPHEIKMKMIAETRLNGATAEERERELKEIIRNKSSEIGYDQEGTTPRRYTDLIGSLCDLISGSGDKGTPVVLVQGYFDNYADV